MMFTVRNVWEWVRIEGEFLAYLFILCFINCSLGC